ncbi:unnamed protein product [Microthlaspi erraticum]|uniref:Uncharacterized protein n=1 Tax=Microthlaspi erraticum TaxID=1685480 RepID=A0A6D2JFV7_9BRAS|nr:unnamed protein product [Microthlaspi erraticum]
MSHASLRCSCGVEVGGNFSLVRAELSWLSCSGSVRCLAPRRSQVGYLSLGEVLSGCEFVEACGCPLGEVVDLIQHCLKYCRDFGGRPRVWRASFSIACRRRFGCGGADRSGEFDGRVDCPSLSCGWPDILSYFLNCRKKFLVPSDGAKCKW